MCGAEIMPTEALVGGLGGVAGRIAQARAGVEGAVALLPPPA